MQLLERSQSLVDAARLVVDDIEFQGVAAAHYGVIHVAVGEERKMVGWATRLLANARAAVEA